MLEASFRTVQYFEGVFTNFPLYFNKTGNLGGVPQCASGVLASCLQQHCYPEFILMWQELGVPLKKIPLKVLKGEKKKSTREKTLAAQIQHGAVKLFHTVMLTAANFAQRTFFWRWSLWFLCCSSVVLETLCVLCLLLVTVLTHWGTVRKARDGFDPWVLVLGSNKSKDSTLGMFLWWRKERERFMW